MITINCKNCNAEIQTYPSRVGRTNFCSRKCSASFNMRENKYAVGNKTWIGKKHTEESKIKNSIAHKGIRASESTEFKKGQTPYNKGQNSPHLLARNLTNNPTRRGADSHLWRGGITPINTAIRNSTDYKLWRKAVFERDAYTCQICGQVSGRLNADHIKSFSKHPELRLDIDNGRTLCVPCHKTTDTYAGRARTLVEAAV